MVTVKPRLLPQALSNALGVGGARLSSNRSRPCSYLLLFFFAAIYSAKVIYYNLLAVLVAVSCKHGLD